jgi:hypothetical protein
MPLCFAKPSPPSGWLGDFHPQAIKRARHATNPRSGSRVHSAVIPHDRNRGASAESIRLDWTSITLYSGRQPRVEVTTQNHLQGEIPTPPHRPTQPKVAAYLQRWRISPIFQSLPNIQCPYTQNPCHTRIGCIGVPLSHRSIEASQRLAPAQG